MEALLISCFGCYEFRTRYFEEVLMNHGFTVYHVFSDFDHIKKERIVHKTKWKKKNIISISVPGYTSNISLLRLYSHAVFSLKVKKLLEERKPEFVYALIPPNLLTGILAQYRKKSENTRLVYDIYDLWPESLPVKKGKSLLKPWAWIRNRYLKYSDYTFLECGYYQKFIGNYLNDKTDILYLCQEQFSEESEEKNRFHKEIGFCYLGSVNYIIDIFSITRLLSRIQEEKPVHLHLIGTGEGMENFRALLEAENISYTEYGQVFDKEKKDEIFRKCQYGINMYKKETAIGLTMKSLEYFQAGLPVVTSHIYDTERLILKYEAGIIITDGEIEAAGMHIAKIDKKEWLQLHKNTLLLYKNNFSEEILIRKVEQHLKEILL